MRHRDEVPQQAGALGLRYFNRVDRKKTPPVEWKVQVDAFRLEILEILKRHGCSRQEITHFEVINQFEMAQLDMPFSTAMFLIRVARMTDISSKHARIAESRLLRPD